MIIGSAITIFAAQNTVFGADFARNDSIFPSLEEDLDWGEDANVEDYFTPEEVEYFNFEENNNCKKISRRNLLENPRDFAGKCVTLDTFLISKSLFSYISYDIDNNVDKGFNIQVEGDKNWLVMSCVADGKELTISGFVNIQQDVPNIAAKKIGCSPYR